MVDYIREFELPNPNWYDEQGRIYKDILITNFNAIEDKLNELSSLDALEITVPSWNDVHIEDVDIYTAPDNRVVNLKTLIETLHLVNFPISVKFTGTTCDNIQYYDSTYNIISISDRKLPDLSPNKPYIFLNPVTIELYCTSDYSNVNNHIFIGVYDNGIVNHNYSLDFCDINALSVLSKMPFETQRLAFGNTSDRRGTRTYFMHGRCRTTTTYNTQASDGFYFTHYDCGRKGVKER